ERVELVMVPVGTPEKLGHGERLPRCWGISAIEWKVEGSRGAAVGLAAWVGQTVVVRVKIGVDVVAGGDVAARRTDPPLGRVGGNVRGLIGDERPWHLGELEGAGARAVSG